MPTWAGQNSSPACRSARPGYTCHQKSLHFRAKASQVSQACDSCMCLEAGGLSFQGSLDTASLSPGMCWLTYLHARLIAQLRIRSGSVCMLSSVGNASFSAVCAGMAMRPRPDTRHINIFNISRCPEGCLLALEVEAAVPAPIPQPQKASFSNFVVETSPRFRRALGRLSRGCLPISSLSVPNLARAAAASHAKSEFRHRTRESLARTTWVS
jgi:hypothetical protein